MKVVGILVSYNSAADLPLSLGSLAALPVSDIVVVDNASSDDSAEIALTYTPHVLRLPNVGFGKAINAAVEYLPGADAYLLINPDCGIHLADFHKLTGALTADPALGAVAPLMRYPNGEFGISAGPEMSIAKEWLAALRVDHLVPRRARAALSRSRLLRRLVPMLAYLDTKPAAAIQHTAWVSGFCMLVRREAFEQVGGFDPAFFLYFEDVDLCKRMRASGWRVGSVGTSVALHRESTSTGAVGKNRLYRDGMVVYFDRHGARIERVLARALRRFPL
ncbi:MAG: glycosyltransferase [Hamadaea sp.]|uniref:glycosyltransferase family 2 protein n=1 Tax=Hamadaea sp. TaxID=2024425 RepID=UPI0017A29241|nr:glycosyltransferase [Hamadaea sp.]NUT22829.1 glycosyltransferase [Hamadaea sp.]